MDSDWDTWPCCQVGCPIRSRPAHRMYAAPRTHFGACPVLLRPLTPRHPPCPLRSLALSLASGRQTRSTHSVSACPDATQSVSSLRAPGLDVLLALFGCSRSTAQPWLCLHS